MLVFSRPLGGPFTKRNFLYAKVKALSCEAPYGLDWEKLCPFGVHSSRASGPVENHVRLGPVSSYLDTTCPGSKALN